jgi:hypothetical protein
LTVSNVAESGRAEKQFQAVPVEGNVAVVVKEHAYKADSTAAPTKPSSPTSASVPQAQPQVSPNVNVP